MPILEEVYVTEDEEYLAESRIVDQVRAALEGLKFDTYNAQYVVRVIVTKVSYNTPNIEDDE